MSARSTRATDAARRAGIDHTVHDVGHLGPADATDTSLGEAVARALGVEPDRVLKTLVAVVDGNLAVGVVPVTRTLDLKALAAAVGGRRATMADPADAERATGYVVGGISPLGHRRRLPTVVDASVGDVDTVYVSAGRRGLELELSPADLVAVTDATVAAVSR